MTISKWCFSRFALYFAFLVFPAIAIATPANWIVVNASNAFTLRAPPGTVFRHDQGIDSFVGGFDGPRFKMDFDFGIYSNTLSEFTKIKGIVTEHTEIDGNSALIISGSVQHNEFGCKHFVVAAYIESRSRGLGGAPNSLEISACVNSKDEMPIVEEIYRSIRFS